MSDSTSESVEPVEVKIEEESSSSSSSESDGEELPELPDFFKIEASDSSEEEEQQDISQPSKRQKVTSSSTNGASVGIVNEELTPSTIETTNEPSISSGNNPTETSTSHQSASATMEADDSDSDLEVDIVQLSRSSQRNASTSVQELTLSDEDVDPDQPSTSVQSSSAYGLRKRSARVSYVVKEEHSDEDEPKKHKLEKKKEQLDICSLTNQSLKKYIKTPSLSEDFWLWCLILTKPLSEERLALVSEFFQKCGKQAQSFVYLKPSSIDFNKTLEFMLEHTSFITKFSYQYDTRKDLLSILKIIKALRAKGHLKALNSLKLISQRGDGIIKAEDLQVLTEMQIRLQNLELGDALWEDIQPSLFERLLESHKSTLETLVIHGGFKGDTNKARVTVEFPKMEKMESLVICPKYGFISERKNPLSKKMRVVTLDKKKEEPFKFAVKFPTDPPKLEKLILGNLVEIEELSPSLVRKLKVFRCGSNWNLSISFPPEGSRQALKGSSVTELQLPDALKDPSFIPKVAKFFPNLTKVWIFLPSVPVLRAFFKNMENASLEELYLKTQFDFESTMESCLLPNDSDALKRSDTTNSQVSYLRKYRHFDDYVKYYNIELPLESKGDLMEGNSAGISALKSLKTLTLEHIPRLLLIPIKNEERKWYDHNCKFLSQTFGYEKYPFSKKCHQEICNMRLDRYNWKNLDICEEVPTSTDEDVASGVTTSFSQAGYVDSQWGRVKDYADINSDDEEFIPVTSCNNRDIQQQRRQQQMNSERKKALVSVAIQPSMLLPEGFKEKQEN